MFTIFIGGWPFKKRKERRGVLPVFATQVRFKTKLKKRNAKDPHVSIKEKKFFKQKKRYETKK
jgi:hypothetical protein